MFWQYINSQMPKLKYFSLIVRVFPCLSISVLRVWWTVTRGRCHISTLVERLLPEVNHPAEEKKSSMEVFVWETHVVPTLFEVIA